MRVLPGSSRQARSCAVGTPPRPTHRRQGDTDGVAILARRESRAQRPGQASAAEPELVQLLTPDGERLDKATGPDGVEYSVDFTDDEYRELYRDLVTVRRLDAEATALQRQGELGIWASLLGPGGRAGRLRPGAAAAGHGLPDVPRARRPLLPRASTRSCRSACSAGVDQGGWDPNEFKFNMYTIVIGAQTLHATGYAMGITMDGKIGSADGEAVIAYFGDGATCQGDVNEAFVWASVFNAPIVFFCQNNQYAISEPLERQTRVPLYQRAAGFGFPGVRVDGNDVLATLRGDPRGARRTPAHGEGPTLIEAYTYRMGAHTTLGRPDPLPHRQRGRGLAGQGPDRPAEGVPGQAADRRRRLLRRGRRDGRAVGASTCASGCSPCPTRSR